MGDVLSFEEDLSRIGLINSTDAVENRRLPSSIGSDDGTDGSFLHLKANIIQGSDAAERDGEVFYLEDGVHIFLKKLNRVGETLASRFKGDQSRPFPLLFTLCVMPYGVPAAGTRRFSEKLLGDLHPVREFLNRSVWFHLSVKDMLAALSIHGMVGFAISNGTTYPLPIL